VIENIITSRAKSSRKSVSVVIPCYRTGGKVLDVITAVPEFVYRIYCVDDACPEKIGELIEEKIQDPRVRVLRHSANQGVGGATITGYEAAILDKSSIIVKLDGDGQMDPKEIGRIIQPIRLGKADYVKGNRFFRLEDLRQMPATRLFGNAVLSFMAKLSTGYWNLFDPTNGFTAIHLNVLRELPLEKLSRRYFFETDMLFRLNTVRAVVQDVPLPAHYNDEHSSLSICDVIWPFLTGHLKNFLKRIFYSYYLRDFQLASIEFLLGPALVIFGTIYGISSWMVSAEAGIVTPAGTVMLAALPIILGFQLFLAALSYDISNVPTRPLHPELENADEPD
jgi:dolichol-phosphate mannosyltransferase